MYLERFSSGVAQPFRKLPLDFTYQCLNLLGLQFCCKQLSSLLPYTLTPMVKIENPGLNEHLALELKEEGKDNL